MKFAFSFKAPFIIVKIPILVDHLTKQVKVFFCWNDERWTEEAC